MTELETIAYLVEWYDAGDRVRVQLDTKIEPWLRANEPVISKLVTLSSAQSAIAERDARIAELDEEIGRLEDENSDLRCEPWPEWARAVLNVIRKHSGYDGYDDATEGVDMPLELSEHLSEMEAEAGRWQARAEAAEALLKEAVEGLHDLERYVALNCFDQWLPEGHAKTSVLSRKLDAARSLASKIGGGE